MARDLRLELRAAHEQALVEMQARGLKILDLTPAQQALWRSEADASLPKLRDRYVPPRLFDRVMELRKQYRETNPPARRP